MRNIDIFLSSCILALNENMISNMDKVEEAPGLANLFPPSTSVVNSVSMKLPVFWPDAAEFWRQAIPTRY